MLAYAVFSLFEMLAFNTACDYLGSRGKIG